MLPACCSLMLNVHLLGTPSGDITNGVSLNLPAPFFHRNQCNDNGNRDSAESNCNRLEISKVSMVDKIMSVISQERQDCSMEGPGPGVEGVFWSS